MLELMSNDLAAVSSVTEGTVRWCPGDAYSQALENKPEYAGRVRQTGPGILLVRGSTQTYYTPSQSRTQNTGDSSHMAERIRELEAERDQQQAKIEELENQVALKEFENEACFRENDTHFRRLEALLLHGSSSSSFPEVPESGGHPEGGKHAICVVIVFLSVNMTIVQLDHFNGNA
jgi:uncharacterized coiled-coil protein SlyX